MCLPWYDTIRLDMPIISISNYGNFIIDEYTHSLRLESELLDLWVWYANPYSENF